VKRRDFFGGLIGALTGWRYGGKTETLPIQADLSYSSLQTALEHIGVPYGQGCLLVVSPHDAFVAKELLHGDPTEGMQWHIDRALPEFAWFIQYGTHRVWGSPA